MGAAVSLVTPNPAAGNVDQRVSAANPFPMTTVAATSGAVTNVNDSATSVTLLTANTNRKACVITNTSSAILYVRLASGTASALMFTYRLPQNATQEITMPYTGIITGVWATDPNDGVAVVTELV